MQRPPLGLTVNVTDSSGATTRWSSNDPNPENRPRNITFGSQRMQGFSTASLDLSRRIDRDYVDLHLYDDVQIIGDDGSIAWEGRIGSNPRTVDTSHTMSIQCAGWMANAKDRKFSQLYIDRDLSHWGPMSRARRAVCLAGNLRVTDPTIVNDPTSGSAAIQQEVFASGDVAPNNEALYDAGLGNAISGIVYAFTTTNWNSQSLNANCVSIIYVAGTAELGSPLTIFNANATVTSSTQNLMVPTTPARYAALRLYYGTAVALLPGTPRTITWTNLAVLGNHGLAFQGANTNIGYYASDVIRNIIANYCPKLNAAGVQNTTYPIPHLVYRDPTDPYDAFLDVNKYHLWDLSCWENKTVYYAPTDLTDYDWEVRLGDPGTSTTLQGDTTEDLANGIAVTYTNVATGTQDRLTPDVYPELRDLSVDNPANQHGLTVWTEYQLSVPTTLASALQIGRAALAEFNQPKAPGSITVGPYARDRQGNWQQAWKVRSGDRVAITSSSSLSDRPRLVHDVSYTHGPNGVGQATISVDSTFKTLPAVLDRITTALSAANLT